MSPAVVAALCGVLYSPPALWDDLPLPPGAVVREVPFSELSRVCSNVDRHYAAGRIYGCAYPGQSLAYVPTWKTWPGTRECWLEIKRHETAHLKGWIHP